MNAIPKIISNTPKTLTIVFPFSIPKILNVCGVAKGKNINVNPMRINPVPIRI